MMKANGGRKSQWILITIGGALLVAAIAAVLAMNPAVDNWKDGATDHWSHTSRLTGRTYLRGYMTESPAGNFESAEGPLSASGKRHGRWLISTWTEGGTDFRDVEQWYWYGEPVTEAEFRLRE